MNITEIVDWIHVVFLLYQKVNTPEYLIDINDEFVGEVWCFAPYHILILTPTCVATVSLKIKFSYITNHIKYENYWIFYRSICCWNTSHMEGSKIARFFSVIVLSAFDVTRLIISAATNDNIHYRSLQWQFSELIKCHNIVINVDGCTWMFCLICPILTLK